MNTKPHPLSLADEIARRARIGAPPPKCASFMTGLDDGPWLPGRAPRKASAPKTADELRSIREKAWETRRRVYGERGHR